MSKFKYHKLSNTQKIRYLSNNYHNNLYVVFLHGFMSDLEGEKPRTFLKTCKKKKIGFLAVEYSGHGKSSGEFTKGNISKWTYQTKTLIQKIVKKNQFILIGSSMGSWISVNQFKYFKNQIKGFVGIGSAPEFLTRLMWNKFPKNIRDEIIKKGIATIKNGGYVYPITYQLIKDGRKNKVLNKKILKRIFITMIHGSKDESVPVIYSKKIIKIFKNADKKLLVIKNGDHSLSSKRYLKKIIFQLNMIVSNFI